MFNLFCFFRLLLLLIRHRWICADGGALWGFDVTLLKIIISDLRIASFFFWHPGVVTKLPPRRFQGTENEWD